MENKWFLKGGRGSGKTIRALYEVYGNRIAELEQDLSNKKLAIQNRKADIERLEKENAELKARLQKKTNTTTVSDYPYSALKLEEAKEIIKKLVDGIRVISDPKVELTDVNSFVAEAEKFLKEIEK